MKEKNIEKALETQILALAVVYGAVKVVNILRVFASKKPVKETIEE